jgi:hypothetical protein
MMTSFDFGVLSSSLGLGRVETLRSEMVGPYQDIDWGRHSIGRGGTGSY